MKTSEILINDKNIILKPANLTRGTFARDTNGREIEATNSNAVSFCAIGAIIRVTNNARDEGRATDYLGSVITGSVSNYNDTHEHESILAMFDKAIELAKDDEENHDS